MKPFNSLREAAEYAVTLSDGWHFANTSETYEKESLLPLAQTSDEEDPIDEDNFYLVSSGGSIGLCEDAEDIDWLFIANAEKDTVLPDVYSASTDNHFCSQCGHRLAPGANFCDECGAKLN